MMGPTIVVLSLIPLLQRLMLALSPFHSFSAGSESIRSVLGESRFQPSYGKWARIGLQEARPKEQNLLGPSAQPHPTCLVSSIQASEEDLWDLSVS